MGVRTVMMQRLAMFQIYTGSLLRSGLHPTDLDGSLLHQSKQRILAAAADQRMRVLTYGQLIDRNIHHEFHDDGFHGA